MSMIWVSAVLSLCILAVIVGGLWSRIKIAKGIGWQFIRYTVIAIAIPATVLLALNNMLTEGAVAILSGALGFAFGKQSDGKED
ncbi:hypothetical protein NKI48_34040 [Mesorhizobium sp. M0644]|uniref:hypothetical protein n=1 Tax=Mesorhizobium sp. M0644 TaxID=2956979 RepID=UPI00333886CE